MEGIVLVYGGIVIVAATIVLRTRLKMLRRAKTLLQQMPNHQSTIRYLKSSSAFVWQKQREIDARIAEMANDGWLFLKTSQPNLLKTVWSWEGGINLHFIRDRTHLDCTK